MAGFLWNAWPTLDRNGWSGFEWNGWLLSTGISGRVWIGIGGWFGVEYAGKDALGGFRLKQLSFEVGSGWSGPYDFVIIDEGKQEVCSYRRAFLDGKDSVEIPYEYHARIDSQQWAVSLRRVRSEPTIQVRVLPA